MAKDALIPATDEVRRRDEVLERIRSCVREGRVVPLDRSPEGPYAGSVGAFRYIFEGEDDLLHLAIYRPEGGPLEPGETLAVAQFLLPGVPEALVWLRPGQSGHHYYLGHDILFPA